METLAGPGAEVHFTHLSHASCTTLASRLSSTSSDVARGIVHYESITDLLSSLSPPVPLSEVCLLDPKAPQALAPEDGDAFEWFLFGVRMIPRGLRVWSDVHDVVLTVSFYRAYSVRSCVLVGVGMRNDGFLLWVAQATTPRATAQVSCACLDSQLATLALCR